MRNFWLVAQHEYRKMVTRKGFLLGVVGIPLLMAVVMGATIFMTLRSLDTRPIGYLDPGGLMVNPQPPEDDLVVRAYSDPAAAQADLAAGEIQAYYRIAADYPATKAIELFYWDDAPAANLQADFAGFLRQNLAAGLPDDVQARLVEGPLVTVRSLDGSREMGDGNVLGFMLPFVASFLFIFTVMNTAGYLLQVVAGEKENRTVEVLLTSLSPEALIGGKALGLMGVALTQLAVWVLTLVVGLFAAMRIFDWAGLARFPWDYVLLVVLFFVPSYALIAGLMTAIGGAVTELRQGQQIAGLLNLLFVAPMFFTMIFITNPNGPLALFLTFFPSTAFLTISLRWGMNVVPAWQVIGSWLILTASAVGSVWASARIFRAGMLRYGQRMDLRAAWAAVRGRREDLVDA